MISPEELFLSASCDKRISALSLKSKTQLTSLFGECFAEMKGYEQKNPHHCYDLLSHTIHTVLAIHKNDLPEKDFVCLRIAALFHDIGKPAVAFWKNDRQVFYGHAEKSSEIAFNLLSEIGLEQQDIKKIRFFIKHHDDFISFKHKDEFADDGNPHIKLISRDAVMSKVKSIQEKSAEHHEYIPKVKDFKLLFLLCKADAEAQKDVVMQGGNIVDSKENKIKRFEAIISCLDLDA